jgi:cytochrome P450 family 4
LHPFHGGLIICGDPAVIEKVILHELTKADNYKLLNAWLGTGLITSSGEKWFQRRKILTPAFHFKILEKYVEIIDEQGKIFIENFGKFDGMQVDVFPLANLYALDVICEAAMGFKINAQNMDSEYVRAVKE